MLSSLHSSGVFFSQLLVWRWACTFLAGIIALLLVSAPGSLAQTIRYVTSSGTQRNPATATSWATATADLQGAISASNAGDQVWVASGTYKPGGNDNTDRSISFSMKNGVSLFGGFVGNETRLSQRPAIDPVAGNPSSSTLSGDIGTQGNNEDNSFRVISNPPGLTTTAVLDGFVITSGNNGNGGSGGGMYNDGRGSGQVCSPLIRHCAFLVNTARFGGAMYNDANNGTSSPMLTNCFFQGNTAYNGGAISNNTRDGNASPTLTNCTFLNNAATEAGGAIRTNSTFGGTSSPSLINCVFLNNNAGGPAGAFGCYAYGVGSVSSPTLTNCTFRNNSASSGGAMENRQNGGTTSPTLTNCAFVNNTASYSGGAVENTGEFTGRGTISPTMINCAFQGNRGGYRGGAFYNFANSGRNNLILVNCSFQANEAGYQGSAILNYGRSSSKSTLTNCVVFGNKKDNAFKNIDGATITATYSLFDDMDGVDITGPGNFTTTTSPFVANTDVALAPGSRAINAANPASTTVTSPPYSEVALPPTDVAGNPRIEGGRIDMGASEFQSAVPKLLVSASPNPVCDGSPVRFTATVENVTGTYNYTLTNGTTPPIQGVATGSPFSLSLTASGTGAQIYTLSVTDGGATVKATFTLTVNPLSPDLQPLVDFYNTTNGPNWSRKTNWLTGCTPCGWQGVSCDGNGRVTGLSLPGNNLNGALPASLTALSGLQSLDLSTNQLRGTIPAGLSALRALQALNLIGNQLEGSIPASLSALSALQSLELGANALTGGIPTGIGSLTALQTLNLSRTQLGGTIPASLGQLTRLQNLYLNESMLTGSLPASLGGLSQLRELALNINQLSGCFPASYTALCGRAQISFTNNPGLPGGGNFGAYCSTGSGSELVVSQYPQSGNACVGSAFSFSVVARGAGSYQWYKDGQRLAESGPVLTISPVTSADAGTYQVYINYGCRPGAVQSDFVTLTVGPSSPDYQPLADLFNSTNGPGWTNKTNWLTGCDVCTWQGVTCTNGRVTGLDLTSNNLRGTLPASLSGLTSLQSLMLGTNQLTGTIPASLGTLPNLQTLILFQNSLTGSIPASLGSRTTLQVLNLSANQLEGAIPDQLGNLTQLRVLNLGNNRLTGTLPASLSALTGVQAFDLSRNQLTGSIPAGYGALQNTIILNINNNQLSGCFPTSLTALCAYGAVIERIAMPVSLRGARQLAMGGGTNDKVNVTNNAGLPGGGDFDSFCANDAGRCNTAPVATANASQTATVGRAFSYTVAAFTDAETPNGLTYAALFSPASSGLSFDAATRMISGTPSEPGPVSVTITATDPGGLMASTSFSISVGQIIVGTTPLRATLTASPQTLLTSGSTVLRAAASGGNAGAPPSGYTYRFSGPGDFAASQANEVTVTNLSAGVQTFTVVVSDATQPTSQTTSATVSVTVTAPTATAALRVLHQDADNGQLTNNAIKPNLQIENTGTTPIDYGQLTLRYWLTVENFAALSNLQVYYAQLGNNKVKMKYVSLDKPRQGALGYVEYSFTGSPGSLAPGANSGPIQSGIAKQDYSNFNEADDYSYANTRSLTANARITAHLDGKLVWGTEPAEVAAQQLIKAYTESRSSGANTISTYLQVRNEGNVPVDYKEVKVRYYFTSEGNQPLNFYLDYAVLGNNKITSQFVRLSPALTKADTYLELSFSPSLGTFSPASSTGNIQYRIAKQDWSDFTQNNDHSFQSGAGLSENNRVVVYVSGVRVWGNEPGAGGRIGSQTGTGEYDASLRVTVLGNPVQGAAATVEVRGAEGQPLRLQLTDLSGRLVSEQVVERAGAVERRTIGLDTQSAGLLLLQVSTPTQRQTVKIIKAE